MFTFIIFLFITTLTSVLFIFINILIFKKSKKMYEKSVPIECGFNSINSTSLPFSIQFYYISILFLIFDIELSLILPMIQPIFFSLINHWMKFSLILVLLIIGLYFEWWNNLIKWN